MDDIGITMHPVFGLAATGFVVLNLADPAWWPTGVGWVALTALLAAWGIHGIKRDSRR
jgi:hypothetical protein